MNMEKIERGLRDLRADFPLEDRVLQESIAVQAAYVHALRYWIGHDRPPTAEYLPADAIEHLVSADALVVTTEGVGIYPFSAQETDIRLHNGTHRPICTMCAVDALVIPALWQSQARLETRCHACHRSLSFVVGAGSKPYPDAELSEVYIHLRNRQSRAEQPACGSLCTKIYFLCSHCAAVLPPGARYTLQEAQVIGQQFFAFQHGLLRAFPNGLEEVS